MMGGRNGISDWGSKKDRLERMLAVLEFGVYKSLNDKKRERASVDFGAGIISIKLQNKVREV